MSAAVKFCASDRLPKNKTIILRIKEKDRKHSRYEICSFVEPHAVLNLYDILLSMEDKEVSKNVQAALFHITKVDRIQRLTNSQRDNKRNLPEA